MKVGVNLFKKEKQKYNLISYTNEEELTLKEVLLDKLNFSVRSISKMKRDQSVFVNGVFKKPSIKLKKGDLIEVRIDEEMANFEAQNLNLDILYDDFDIIMVNKPPFMVVHPTKSHFDNTIANGITYYIKEKNENVKIRFVNRLDMNTSGLVIVAKNAYAHHTLSVDMENNDVEKKYIAKLNKFFEISDLKKLQAGIEIDGVACVPTRVKIKTNNRNKDFRLVQMNQGNRRNAEILGL